MGLFRTLDISASGLTAQRMRMDTITENLANAGTTRTADGEPYRRRVTVLSEKNVSSFSSMLSEARRAQDGRTLGNGVKVAAIVEDMSDFRLEYDPTHPDADEEGYVSYPNVDEAAELIDMMAATRAFEANVTAFNATKSMALKSFEIGK